MKNANRMKLFPVGLAVSMLASGVQADTFVKIGHVAPLTGEIAHLGKDQENGARLAIEEINKKGLTIGGQKVTLEIDAQDDAADPRQATQGAKKLGDDNAVAGGGVA